MSYGSERAAAELGALYGARLTRHSRARQQSTKRSGLIPVNPNGRVPDIGSHFQLIGLQPALNDLVRTLYHLVHRFEADDCYFHLG